MDLYCQSGQRRTDNIDPQIIGIGFGWKCEIAIVDGAGIEDYGVSRIRRIYRTLESCARVRRPPDSGWGVKGRIDIGLGKLRDGLVRHTYIGTK